MILRLYTDDGECVFAGRVPNDSVEIHRTPNQPATLFLKTGAIKDALAELETKEVRDAGR